MARQLYGRAPRVDGVGPSMVLTRNAELPNWFRCYVVYWRRLEVRSVNGETMREAMRGLDTTTGLYLAGGGYSLLS